MNVHGKTSLRATEGNEKYLCGVCGKDGIYGIDSCVDDEAEEGIAVKGVKNVYLPLQLDMEKHEVTHIPFRNWCPHCVKGSELS